MLSQGPYRGLTVGAVIVLVGIAVIVYQMPSRSAAASSSRRFFTVDDGKTWFADDANKLPPFDKDGRQAVLAHVYRSADGTEFVNYLERLKPEAKRVMEDANTSAANRKGPPNLAAIRSAYADGREVKRPGDAKWISTADSRETARVMAIKSPNGSAQAVEIEP
jgi:hypothetical protein